MTKLIARHCDQCKKYHQIPIPSDNKLICPECHHKWGEIKNPNDVFDYCPVCNCRQFYLSKDFNQFIGCSIMLIGIVLVPFTYGLSLPVFALIDWSIHRKVKTITNCYRCGTEFHNFNNAKRFKPFLHHIGLKYDKYR